MPTYEYACRACGHEFEVFHSIMADPISVCPKCRKKKVERMIGTGGAVIFKGGGFYETDYRSESYKAGADADSKAAKPSESSASAASETNAASTGAEAAKREVSAKEGAAGKPSRDAASGSGADAKGSGQNGSEQKGSGQKGSEPPKRGSEPGAKSAPKGKSSADSSASAAENRRIEERATHRSRIGRGVGNIVKKKTPRRK